MSSWTHILKDAPTATSSRVSWEGEEVRTSLYPSCEFEERRVGESQGKESPAPGKHHLTVPLVAIPVGDLSIDNALGSRRENRRSLCFNLSFLGFWRERLQGQSPDVGGHRF